MQEVKILKEELDNKNRQVKKETKDLEARKEELEKFKVHAVILIFFAKECWMVLLFAIASMHGTS